MDDNVDTCECCEDHHSGFDHWLFVAELWHHKNCGLWELSEFDFAELNDMIPQRRDQHHILHIARSNSRLHQLLCRSFTPITQPHHCSMKSCLHFPRLHHKLQALLCIT